VGPAWLGRHLHDLRPVHLLREREELKALKTAATLFVAVCIEWVLLVTLLSSSAHPHTVRTVVLIVVAIAVGVSCAITVFRINRHRPDPAQLIRSSDRERRRWQ
jgi:hypothetical protein